jgi:hypothetical protein
MNKTNYIIEKMGNLVCTEKLWKKGGGGVAYGWKEL